MALKIFPIWENVLFNFLNFFFFVLPETDKLSAETSLGYFSYYFLVLTLVKLAKWENGLDVIDQVAK